MTLFGVLARWAALTALFASVAGVGYWAVAQQSPPAGIVMNRAFESLAKFQYEPPVAGSYQLPVIKAAPDGPLLNHTGAQVTLQEPLQGKYALVSFVYLNCADVEGCPLAMATLWQIFNDSRKVVGLRDEVQLATISFDPQRDTPQALNAIVETIKADRAANKKLNWFFYTAADQAMLKPLLSGFGQVVNKSKNSDTLNHLLRLYLLDRQGNIRNVYGLGSIDPRLIMTDVQTLLIQEGKHL